MNQERRGPGGHRNRQRAHQEQEYLEMILHLVEDGQRVSPGALARQMGVSNSTAAEWVRRLESASFVARGGDQSVMLTEKGKHEALRVVRRHRLAERFLADVLGVPWERVHDEACELEHALSDESEQGLLRLVGDRRTCPHGNPIPVGEEFETHQERRCLLDEPCGCRVRISHIVDEETEDLRQLLALGLLPGVEVEIGERAPFGGPLMVKIGRARYSIDCGLAAKIRVAASQEESRLE